MSAAEGHLDVVKFLLLQPGIDINAKDRNGFTALLGMCFKVTMFNSDSRLFPVISLPVCVMEYTSACKI